MAATSAVHGLSDEDLRSIRDTLASGRKPKVMFTEAAGQIAGQIGQVVELTDPAACDEWLVVRFGRDELPFSPVDLAIPPKGSTGRPKPKPAAEAEFKAEFKVVRESVPAPRKEADMTTGSEPPAAESKPPRRSGRPSRPKPPAGLTITVSYTDGEWTVAATQGSRSLAKPYVIKPAEALQMVALIDVPTVQEAVEQILATERAEAERQAEKLRAELAEVEARLAELRDVG